MRNVLERIHICLLDSVFGPGGRQRCVCHKLGNLWDAVADKEAHKSIRREAAEIYDVETAELKKATKEMWANLPDNYQWLKGCEYV